jgi:hypothetical protein
MKVLAYALAFGLALSLAAPTPADAAPFDKLKERFQKAGEKIKAGFEKAGVKFKEAGDKIKEGFVDLGEKFKALGKKIQEFVNKAVKKVREKIDAFGDKVLDELKGLVLAGVSKILEVATNMIGFKISDLEEVMVNGKVSRSKVREIVLRRIVTQFLTPMLSEKVMGLLETAWNTIKPLVDAAVSGAIGGIGSIPGVGGALAAGLHMAYSLGTTALKRVATNKVAKWVVEFLVEKLSNVLLDFAAKKAIAWANTGLDSVRDKWPGIATAMDKVFDGFYTGLEKMLKPAGAVCTVAK